MKHRIATSLGAGLLIAALSGCGSSSATDHDSRQDEVAERGAQVMPFDLEKTTHRFSKNIHGVTETVVADDPADVQQITLIRAHLRKERSRFADGDFADPAAIHGRDMPGLRILEQGAPAIDIRYTDVREGGRITFKARDPDLVNALHAWADAQVDDHGDHAER
jgi:hypothetical protein